MGGGFLFLLIHGLNFGYKQIGGGAGKYVFFLVNSVVGVGGGWKRGNALFIFNIFSFNTVHGGTAYRTYEYTPNSL